MKKVSFILLLCPLFSFAQVYKSGEYKLNDYVNLSTGSCAGIPVPSERARVTYPCSTSAAGKDFFMNYFEQSTCICVCPSGALGSPRPFYRSRKSFETMNLTGLLKLSDTALFARIDTIRQNAGANSCALPYVVLDMGASGVFIVITSDNRYALVCCTPKTNQVQCHDYSDPQHPLDWTQNRLSGYSVKWYIQNSGLALFNWVSQTGVLNRFASLNPRNQAKTSVRCERYSLLGRRVAAGQAGQKKTGSSCPSLYLVKDTRGVRLELW